MRRILYIFLTSFISLSALSQKVTVEVIHSKNIAASDWRILDESYIPVFAGSEFFDGDSVYFSLEAGKRYFMEVSVTDIFDRDTCIYSLNVNSEPILRIVSDITPGDHFYPFFTGVRQDQTKITGGTDASIADYPWQVFFESGGYTCGGSIISGDWIITAAHCTEDDNGVLIPVSAMDVIVGANNPRNGVEGKQYSVSKVIRHEHYDPKTLNNDIALLQLTSAINYTNATPIRLVSKIDSSSGATDPGVMSWVTGYGLTKVSPATIPTTLQKVQLPIVSNAQASVVWDQIAPSDMMAGFHSGNRDACNGDSGGPLVVPVDNEYKLAGLVSWGRATCDTYGAYTRVSIFESWINSNTGIEISYVPPVPSGDSIICIGVLTSQYSVGAIAGATSYEWQLLPAGAGTIQGNNEQAVVTWTQGYTGPATVKLRVLKFNFLSYWSALTVHLAKYNKFISQTNDTTICTGTPVTLRVTAEGYNLNYSWFKDANFIRSDDSNELSFSTGTTDSTGIYRCDISGSCGEVLSPEIKLTVLPSTAINHITPDTKAAFGDDITLEVIADGHNLHYQWQKDSSGIPEATGPQYILADVNASNSGLYKVIVSGSCGVVPGTEIYVYVTDNTNHADPEILVWPTLVSSDFNVALSDDRTYNLQLYNLSGNVIRDKRNCQFRTNVNISDLSDGVYILKIWGNNFQNYVKLIRN